MEWRRLLRVKGTGNMGYVAESAGWLGRMETEALHFTV